MNKTTFTQTILSSLTEANKSKSYFVNSSKWPKIKYKSFYKRNEI